MAASSSGRPAPSTPPPPPPGGQAGAGQPRLFDCFLIISLAPEGQAASSSSSSAATSASLSSSSSSSSSSSAGDALVSSAASGGGSGMATLRGHKQQPLVATVAFQHPASPSSFFGSSFGGSPSSITSSSSSSITPSSAGVGGASSKAREELQKLLRSVPQFCFPDLGKFSRKGALRKVKMENFSFALTESSGEKRWGYCRRFLPPQGSPSSGTAPSAQADGAKSSSKEQMPICFCIISFIPCFSVFSAILDELMKLSWEDGRALIRAVYNHPLPSPGTCLRIRMCGEQRQPLEYSFKRPDDFDSLLDHVNFEPLLHYLDTSHIISIFASLLVERRVIFIADRLSTLSASVQASVALVYPFVWQHVFIPVLPPSLLSFVCAPMPFVVGVLRSCQEDLQQFAQGIESDVVIVDIDNNKVTTIAGKPPSDDRLLPEEPLECLRISIDDVAKRVKEQYSVRGKLWQRKQGVTEAKLSRIDSKFLANAFIGFMVDILSSYRSFSTSTGFNTAAFLDSFDDKMKPLMSLVTQSQMFSMFVQDRQGLFMGQEVRYSGRFEKRVSRQISPNSLRGGASAALINSRTSDANGDGKKTKRGARSRFTMFEIGEISREEIIQSREELLEQEERNMPADSTPDRTKSPPPADKRTLRRNKKHDVKCEEDEDESTERSQEAAAALAAKMKEELHKRKGVSERSESPHAHSPLAAVLTEAVNGGSHIGKLATLRDKTASPKEVRAKPIPPPASAKNLSASADDGKKGSAITLPPAMMMPSVADVNSLPAGSKILAKPPPAPTSPPPVSNGRHNEKVTAPKIITPGKPPRHTKEKVKKFEKLIISDPDAPPPVSVKPVPPPETAALHSALMLQIQSTKRPEAASPAPPAPSPLVASPSPSSPAATNSSSLPPRSATAPPLPTIPLSSVSHKPTASTLPRPRGPPPGPLTSQVPQLSLPTSSPSAVPASPPTPNAGRKLPPPPATTTPASTTPRGGSAIGPVVPSAASRPSLSPAAAPPRQLPNPPVPSRGNATRV